MFLKNLENVDGNAKNVVILILNQEQYVIDVKLQSNQNRGSNLGILGNGGGTERFHLR